MRTCSRELPDEWRFTLTRGPQTAARAGLSADTNPGDAVVLKWEHGNLPLRLVGWETAPGRQGVRVVIASAIVLGTDSLARHVWQGDVTALFSEPWVKIAPMAALDLQKLSLHVCRPAPVRPPADSDNRVLAAVAGWLEREADIPVFLLPNTDRQGGLLLQTAGDLPELHLRPPQDRTRDDRLSTGWGGPPGATVIDEAWQVPLVGISDVERELVTAFGAHGRVITEPEPLHVVWWQATWDHGANAAQTLHIQRRWQSAFAPALVPPAGSGWTRWARMKRLVMSPPGGGGAPLAEVLPLDVDRGQLVPLPDNRVLRCQLLTPYAGEGGANCGVHFAPEPGALVAVGTPSVFVRPALLGEVREAACQPHGFGLFLPNDHPFEVTAARIKLRANEVKMQADTDVGAPAPPAALSARRAMPGSGAKPGSHAAGEKPAIKKPEQVHPHTHLPIEGIVRVGDGPHDGWTLTVTDVRGAALSRVPEPGHDGRSAATGVVSACYADLSAEAVLKLARNGHEFCTRVPLAAHGGASFAIISGNSDIDRVPATAPNASGPDADTNFLIMGLDDDEAADLPTGKVFKINFPGGTASVDSENVNFVRKAVSYGKKFGKVWKEIKEFGLKGALYIKDIKGKKYAIFTGYRPGHPGEFINLRKTFKSTKYLRDNVDVVKRGVASVGDATRAAARGALKFDKFFFIDVGLRVVEEVMKQDGDWGAVDWPALGGSVVADKSKTLMAGVVGAGIAAFVLAGTAPVWVVVAGGVVCTLAIQKLILDPVDERLGYSKWLGEKTRAAIEAMKDSAVVKDYLRRQEFCDDNPFACVGYK